MFLNVTHDLCQTRVQGLAESPKGTSNFLSLSILISSTDYYFSLWDTYIIFSLSITACDLNHVSLGSDILGKHARIWNARTVFVMGILSCMPMTINAGWHFCNFKPLMNCFRELGCSSIYHAVC